MGIGMKDLRQTCTLKFVSLQKPDGLNLIAAAATDFRFFIEINRDLQRKGGLCWPICNTVPFQMK